MKIFCCIYIVRHAESEANAANILGGNSPLTKKGEEQAIALYNKLLKVSFSAVYSSDLVRAKKTADILSHERSLAVNTTEVLRERNFGVLDGKLIQEVKTELDIWALKIAKMDKDQRYNYHDENGIESDGSLIGRYFTFLREVAVSNLGKNVLIVSHSNVMRTILVHLGYAKLEELPRGSIKNAGFMKILSDGIDFSVTETFGIHKMEYTD